MLGGDERILIRFRVLQSMRGAYALVDADQMPCVPRARWVSQHNYDAEAVPCIALYSGRPYLQYQVSVHSPDVDWLIVSFYYGRYGQQIRDNRRSVVNFCRQPRDGYDEMEAAERLYFYEIPIFC